MSTKIEATDEDDVIEIYSKVVVRRRIPAGVSGPVYVMSCKMNPSKRWEVPCDRIPSSCPWIGYDITEVGDADEDTYRVQLVRAYALPVTPGELQTYARSAGLLKKNKQLRTWFQSQNAKVPLVTAAAIPRVAVELRALVAPALGQSANFYELLILYPDHMLLPLSSEQLAQLMDLYRADTGIIHCWDASSRALTGTVAHTPCAVSLNLSNQPVEIRHAVLATQLLRDAYVETGGTVFAAALDDPERSILLHWDYLRVLPVHSANAPEELAYSTVCDLEKALDIYTDRVECHDFASWLGDFYACAVARADKLDAVIVCPDVQTLDDAMASGVARHGLNTLHAALSCQLGTSLVVLRAERLVHNDVLALCKLATQNLVLIGDARQPHAFVERPGFFCGFAYLFNHSAGTFHPYPRDTDIWQRSCFDAIISGAGNQVDVSDALPTWDQVPKLIPLRCEKDTLFFCNTTNERTLIMEALNRPGAARVSDQPWPGVRYTIPGTGYNGVLLRVNPSRTLEFVGRDPIRTQPLLRGDVSLITQHLGVRYKHVIVIANEFTARAHIAAALKFATDSFRVVFSPDSTIKVFAELEPYSSIARSPSVR